MTHVAHELHEEFPDAADALHRLKLDDAHFRALAERYAAVNHEVHLVEAGLHPVADDVAETLKKERLALKDQIAAMLHKAQAIR